jgi:hypothetical protein
MNEMCTLHHLAPAGYLLLQDAEQARLSHPHRRSFGAYFGVDRLPLLVPADPAIGEEGVPAAQSDSLTRLIDEWLDSSFGNTGFLPTRKQTLEFSKAFDKQDLHFELVYCEVAWKKGEEARLSDYPGAVDPPSTLSLTYGFDISWPSCNHSAIFQPGVVPTSADWRERLNKYGLLNHYEDAVRLRAEYLAVCPPPFDIYLVHSIEKALSRNPTG